MISSESTLIVDIVSNGNCMQTTSDWEPFSGQGSAQQLVISFSLSRERYSYLNVIFCINCGENLIIFVDLLSKWKFMKICSPRSFLITFNQGNKIMTKIIPQSNISLSKWADSLTVPILMPNIRISISRLDATGF